MQKSVWKKLLILCVVSLFCVVSAVALAAEKQWYVLKDSKGVCKVVQLKEKSPKTVAGPFAAKADAQKAKAEVCPKASPGKKEPAKKQ